MRHHTYFMIGSEKPIVGDGDTKSWFLFYKWNSEGENYLPKKHPFIDAEEGDLVWCIMDEHILGAVRVLRVETPPLPVQMQEIWYNADEILELPLDTRYPPVGVSLSETVAERLLERTRKRK